MSNSQTLFQIPTTKTGTGTLTGTVTATGDSTKFGVGACSSIHIDINVSAISGTGASIQFTYNRIGTDGLAYPVWQSAPQSVTGPLSANIGPGLEIPRDPGLQGLLSWTVAGATPSITFSASVRGK